MFMKFEILSGSVTVSGSVSGERGDWTVRVALRTPEAKWPKTKLQKAPGTTCLMKWLPRPWPTLDACAWP